MKKNPKVFKTSNPINISKRTKTIATIAIFSALYSVLRILPTVPMVGVPGASFSVSDVLAPLYGILLGPYIGGVTVILGTFLGMALGKPVVFLGLDFLPAFVNVAALGLLIKRKFLPALILNIALLVGFLVNPLTSIFINVVGIPIPFIWVHIVAFIVLLSPLSRKAVQWVESLKSTTLVAGVAILAFIGTMMQHLMGNILYEIILNQLYVFIGQNPIVATAAYPDAWAFLLFIYPWERLMLIILAVIVGVPIIRVLKKTLLREEKQPLSSD